MNEKEYNRIYQAKYRSLHKDKLNEYHNKYNKINRLKKQENNKCNKCGCSLAGRPLNTKFCEICFIDIKKQVKRESYARCILTYQEYNKKHREVINEKYKKREKLKREDLADRYLIKLLIEKNGFSSDQVKENPELIELKKIILKTKRLCKTLNN